MSSSILVAPFPFKGTLTPVEAAGVIANSLRRSAPTTDVVELPLGDGGTGTLDALVGGTGGTIHYSRCTHAIGSIDECRWGELVDGHGVLEVAECVGLARVPAEKRSPERLSTRGVGELIVQAIDHDIDSLMIGLGDTATHDCGLGMASALGYRFLDSKGNSLPPIGSSLLELGAIDADDVPERVRSIECIALCDVMNPLTGDEGAALRFAGQKGASDETAQTLEEGGHRFATVVLRDLGVSISNTPGAGAAGGLGAGLAAFLGARLISGAGVVMEVVLFDHLLQQCMLVITGEGRVDEKTLLGKGVAVVAQRAARVGVPCIIVAGGVDGDQAELQDRLQATIVVMDQSSAGSSSQQRLAETIGRLRL